MGTAVFDDSWDTQVIRENIRLDRFVPFFGIVAAAVVRRVVQLRNRTAPPNSGYFKTRADELDASLIEVLSLGETKKKAQSIRPVLVVFGGMALTFFSLITQSPHVLRNREQYDAVHPYVSWVSVCILIYLRNSTPELKRVYAGLPAALGRISLETYVLERHVWLASDGTTLLRITSIGNRGNTTDWVQSWLLTIVFVWVAARGHEATRLAVDAMFRKFGGLADKSSM
jgi:hypothetical protein